MSETGSATNKEDTIDGGSAQSGTAWKIAEWHRNRVNADQAMRVFGDWLRTVFERGDVTEQQANNLLQNASLNGPEFAWSEAQKFVPNIGEFGPEFVPNDNKWEQREQEDRRFFEQGVAQDLDGDGLIGNPEWGVSVDQGKGLIADILGAGLPQDQRQNALYAVLRGDSGVFDRYSQNKEAFIEDAISQGLNPARANDLSWLYKTSGLDAAQTRLDEILSFQSDQNAQGQTGGDTAGDVAGDVERSVQDYFNDFINGVINWGDIPSNVQSDPIFNGERPTDMGPVTGGDGSNVQSGGQTLSDQEWLDIMFPGGNTNTGDGTTGGDMAAGDIVTIGGVDYRDNGDGTLTDLNTGQTVDFGSGEVTGGNTSTSTDSSSSGASEGDFWRNLLGTILGTQVGGGAGSNSTATAGATVGDTSATGGNATGGSVDIGDLGSTIDIADLLGDITTQGGTVGDVSGGSVGDITDLIGDISVDNDLGGAFDAIFGEDSWLGDVLGAGTNYAAGEAYKDANKETLDFIKENSIDKLQPFVDMGTNAIPGLEGQVGVPDMIDPMTGQTDINTTLQTILGIENLPDLTAGDRDVTAPEAIRTEVNQNEMFDYQNDPGYQFLRDEGLRAVENSAAARGKLGSGGTLTALQDRGTGLAATYAPMIEGLYRDRDRTQLAADSQFFGQDLTSNEFSNLLNQQDLTNASGIRSQLFGERGTKAKFDLGKELSEIEAGFAKNDQLFDQLFKKNTQNLAFDAQEFGQLADLVTSGQNAAAGQGRNASYNAGMVNNLLQENNDTRVRQGFGLADFLRNL